MFACSRALKSIIGIALAIGLLPLVAYADDGVPERSESGTFVEGGSRDDERSDDGGAASQPGSQDVPVQGETKLLESGTLGDGLTWEYWDDATLKILGSGFMPDFSNGTSQDWSSYLTRMEKVVIGEGVRSIGDRSFYNADLLRSVKLPSTLERIGSEVFYNDRSLAEIEIPDSVTSIGSSAFQRCSTLVSCHLPVTLTEIPSRLFMDCSKLQHVNIPEGLIRIGDRAFCFDYYRHDPDAYLDSLVFPATIDEIGTYAFYGLKVSGDVVIPSWLFTMSSGCDISGLQVKGTLVFEEGITDEAVAGAAWTDCSASRVSIPKSLMLFPNEPIAEDAYLVSADNPVYTAIDGSLFSKKGQVEEYADRSAVLVEAPNKAIAYEVREGTIEIGRHAFGKALSTIDIPASVELIATDGDNFDGENLASITVDEGNEHYCSLEGVLFTAGKAELIRCPRKNEFAHGTFEVPQDTEKMDDSAFERCENLVAVSISSGIEKIPMKCFSECQQLVSIFIPRSVVSIDEEAYYVRLWTHQKRTGVNILYEGSESEWSKIAMSSSRNDLLSDSIRFYDVERGGVSKDGLLYYLDHESALHIVPDDKLVEKTMQMSDFEPGEALWMQFEGSIRSVEFSPKIENVGDHAFDGCQEFEKVTLPTSIADVGESSFANCPKLLRVVCEGDPFEVVAEGEVGASFDKTVELLRRADALGWTDPPAYDEAAGTWNGYRLSLSEDSDYPEIGSVTILRFGQPVEEVTVEGGKNSIPLDLIVLSSDGVDITDKVSVSVEYPKSQRRLAGNITSDVKPGELPVACIYDDVARQVKVGTCSPEGDCTVRVAPKKYMTSGDGIEYGFHVKRTPERVFDSWQWSQNNFPLYGRFQTEMGERDLDAWNQFGESVADRVDVQVIYGNSDLDITDRLDEFGISLEGFESDGCVRYSHLAIPGTYRFRFTAKPGEGMAGSYSGYFTISRQQDLLSVPYVLSLEGGEDEIVLSGEEAWSRTPYRLRTFDCYDDPCWPDPDWTIEDENGRDVTDRFKVDDQGYLFVSNAAKEALRIDGSPASFTIASTANGCVLAKVGIKPYKTGAVESNHLDFTLRLGAEAATPSMHTATFMIGDQEVGRVVFAEGDSSLEEPAMPRKENYVGAWDEYDLASATSDIVIEGRYTPLDPDKVSDIQIEGDALYEDGAVTINLAAIAASKQIRVQSSKTKPVDVVLVCDQSGSMNDSLGNGVKKDALKDCAKRFVTALAENAEKTGADHRVALVGFACSDVNAGIAPNEEGYANTGLLVTRSGGSVKYGSQEMSRAYSEALLPVGKGSAIDARILAGIESIDAEGATAADLGLKMAKGIFAANPATSSADGLARERVVVFITDGVPTYWSNTEDYIATAGTTAISEAKDIKQGQGAHIYSVGVDENADPNASFWSSASGMEWKTVGRGQRELSYDLNRFLHAVSSDYPEATAMSNLGAGSQDAGYYLAVNDVADLSKMFTSILYGTVYSVESFDRATLAYTLPEGFVLTMKQEEEMRAALAEQGIDDDDIVVSEEEGHTTIIFKNVKVGTEYENGVARYAARVSFKVSAKNGVFGSVAGGSATIDEYGDILECAMPDVVVPAERCVLVFKVNGAIYEIRDTSMGDPIELPDTDIARWMDLERMSDPTVSAAYAVFETTTLNRYYEVHWVVGDEEMTESYAPGIALEVPDSVWSWVPPDHDLVGWSPSVPAIMPARNIACTAVLTPKHEHSYTASTYKTGDCTKDLVIHRVCACGEEITESVAPAQAHDFDAHLSCATNSKALTVEELVCKTCGHTIDKRITYEVSRSQWCGSKATVIDLSKYDGEVKQEGDSQDSIEMRFFIGTSFYDVNARYVVTRIDEDGNRYDYETRLKDGYLVFDPDHFSIYVIGRVDPATGRSDLSGMAYADALAILGNPLPDKAPILGPEEVIVEAAPAPSDGDSGSAEGDVSKGDSQSGSDSSGIEAVEDKRLGDLASSAVASLNGVDISTRSPKTGEPLLRLRRPFAPLLEGGRLAA